jgi:hypothetical protein
MGKKENQIWKMACNHIQELLNKVHCAIIHEKLKGDKTNSKEA